MKTKQTNLAPYVFLSPFLICFLIFMVFPIVFSIFLVFQNWSGVGGINTMKFVGLKNIVSIFTQDSLFWKSMGTTFFFLIFGSFSQHLLAIPIAIFLNSKFIKGRNFFRTAYFLPFIISSVSAVVMISYITSDDYGLLNYLLSLANVESIPWNTASGWVPITIIIIINWRFIGWNVMIYLSGLQTIPRTLYESAELDGAPSMLQHRVITLPMLLPFIFLAVTISLVNGMSVFDEPFILTGGMENMGGTNNVGFTAAFYIIWLLQRAQKFGRGSTIAWVLFSILLILTFLMNTFVNKSTDDSTG